jgi:hypothetical protein
MGLPQLASLWQKAAGGGGQEVRMAITNDVSQRIRTLMELETKSPEKFKGPDNPWRVLSIELLHELNPPIQADKLQAWLPKPHAPEQEKNQAYKRLTAAASCTLQGGNDWLIADLRGMRIPHETWH